MDFEYGCSTVNKYAFLDENEVEDPSDLLAQVTLANEAKTAKETKKSDTKGKKTDVKKGGKDTKKPLQSSDNAVKKTGDNKDSGKKQFGDRNQKSAGDISKENRGPKQDRRPRQEGDRPPRQEGDRPPRYDGDRPPRRQGGDRPPRRFDNEGNAVESAEGEGRGGYRGPRGGAHYRGPRGARREEGEGEHRKFDRHSGSEKTGIKAVDKKDGAGKGNWGTATDEVVIEETLGATAEGETKDWAERVDENEEKKEGEVPEEDTPNFMTLEEYKALKSQINKRNDFNIRRPGEGVDQSKWKETYALPKKVDDEDDDEDEESDEEEAEDETEDPQKKELIKSVQSAFKFESTNVPDRNSRGNRGGPRGPRPVRKPEGETEAVVAEPAATEAGEVTSSPAEKKFRQGGQRTGQQGRGGRGAGRQAQSGRGPMKSAPKFDDEKDFPTLGK